MAETLRARSWLSETRNIRKPSMKRQNLFIFDPIKRQNHNSKHTNIIPLYALMTEAASKTAALEQNHTVNTLSPSQGQSDLLDFVASAHNIQGEVIFKRTTVKKQHLQSKGRSGWSQVFIVQTIKTTAQMFTFGTIWVLFKTANKHSSTPYKRL